MQSEHEKLPARKEPDTAMVIGIIALIIAVLVMLSSGFMGFGMMGRGFMGPGFMHGFGFSPWWGLLRMLFWILLIGSIVLLTASLLRQGRPTGFGPSVGGSRALEILQERYAKGEITREQYEEMRRDLAG
ncbi:MAG TPA: SHOCT domain-containing protein [Nitrolancea sp.]|nr:SHOCT domain-containing protein [Nitrolancea sp.]